MKIAFVFSGQGDQYIGMGSSLYENFPSARCIMDSLESLRPGIKEMCFSGNKDELNQTRNTQPCLFAVDMMSAVALQAEEIEPEMVAGFSLGEIPALTFSGVFNIEDAFNLVCHRGQWMEEAAKKNSGAMTAVLRLDAQRVKAICEEIDSLWAVNFNCPQQTVVAGSLEAMDKLTMQVAQAGGRTMRLSVSGAFHCPFMEEVAEKLYDIINEIGYKPAGIPVYSNLTAMPYSGDYAHTLSQQVHNPVLWEQSIRHMAAEGIDTFVEVGPGKTLSGLIRRILPDARVFNCRDCETLTETIKALKGG